MGLVIEFKSMRPRRPGPADLRDLPRDAEILLFTGVRRERRGSYVTGRATQSAPTDMADEAPVPEQPLS